MRRSHEAGLGKFPTALRRLVVAMGLVAPSFSLALGLGDITAQTGLNQPLHAEIPLLSLDPGDLSDIQIRLGSADAFKKLGIARPGVLTHLKFSPDASGKPVIEVTTVDPVKEPFLNFLVEVRWPKGRVLREYTLLLDVPVVANSSEPPAVAAPATPGAVAAAPAPVASKTEPAHAEQAASPAEPVQVPAPAAGSRNHPGFTRSIIVGSGEKPQSTKSSITVRRNDTLSALAQKYGESDVSLDQMMIALYRANRRAFFGNNINNLRAGAILKVPAEEKIAATTSSEARRIVSQHHAEWRKAVEQRLAARSKPAKAAAPAPDTAVTEKSPAVSLPETTGKLEILADNSGPNGAKSPGGSPTAQGDGKGADDNQLRLMREQAQSKLKENQELSARVQQLEGLMTKQQKVIDIQQQELSNLQQKLKAASSKAAPSESKPAAQPAPATPIPSKPAIQQPEHKAPEQKSDAGAQPEAEKAVSAPATGTTTVENPPPGQGAKPKNLLLAAGVVALAVAVAAGIARRREKHDSSAVAEAMRQTGQSSRSAGTANIDSDQEAGELQKEDAGSAAVEAEGQSGVLADADVYLAYGLHAQAEQLLSEALHKEPERDDYRFKLIEVYYSAKNKSKFDELANEIYERAGGSGPIWERVYEMGQDLSPDNPLFFPPPLGGMEATGIAGDFPAEGIEQERGARWSEFLGGRKDREGQDLAETAPEVDMTYAMEEPARSERSRDHSAKPSAAIHEDVDTALLANLDIEPGAASPAGAFSAPKPRPQESYSSRSASVLDSELEQAFASLDDTTLRDLSKPAANVRHGRSQDEDSALSFAEDVGAKLDLAKAYLDMGDSEGARSLLGDVLTEGNAAQREEAKRLQQQIG